MNEAIEAINQVKRLNSGGLTAYICVDEFNRLSVCDKYVSFSGLRLIEVCKPPR